MDFIKDFISVYGSTILYSILTAIAGYLGIVIKNFYAKYIDDKTKKDVVETCVKAIEQLYKDLRGDEKLQKAIEAASEMLAVKGVTISEVELRLLIEASVAEFNDAFNRTSTGVATEAAAESTVESELEGK